MKRDSRCVVSGKFCYSSSLRSPWQLVKQPSLEQKPEKTLKEIIKQTCFDCHNNDNSEDGLDLELLQWEFESHKLQLQWIQIHDRIAAGERPPDPSDLSKDDRQTLLKTLSTAIYDSDHTEVPQFRELLLQQLFESRRNSQSRLLPALPFRTRDRFPENFLLPKRSSQSDLLTCPFNRVQKLIYNSGFWT